MLPPRERTDDVPSPPLLRGAVPTTLRSRSAFPVVRRWSHAPGYDPCWSYSEYSLAVEYRCAEALQGFDLLAHADLDRTRCLSRDEFAGVVTKYGLLDDAEVDYLFAKADSNANGLVEVDDFIRVVDNLKNSIREGKDAPSPNVLASTTSWPPKDSSP